MLAIYWDSTQAEITFIYQMVCQQVINQRVFCSFIKQPFYEAQTDVKLHLHSSWSLERREQSHMPLKTLAGSGLMLQAYGYCNISKKSQKAVNSGV